MKTKPLLALTILVVSSVAALAADPPTNNGERWTPYEITLLPSSAERVEVEMNGPTGSAKVLLHVEAFEAHRPNSEVQRHYFSFFFDPKSKFVSWNVRRGDESPLKSSQNVAPWFWVIPDVGLAYISYNAPELLVRLSSMKADSVEDARKKILADIESIYREGKQIPREEIIYCPLNKVLDPDFFNPFLGEGLTMRKPRSVEFVKGRWKIEFASTYKPDVTAVVELDRSFKPVWAWQNGKQVYPRSEGWTPPPLPDPNPWRHHRSPPPDPSKY
jgi:hypothetical protein